MQMLTEPNQRATTLKKPGHYRNQCRLLKKLREQTENNQTNPGNKNSDANKSNPTAMSRTLTATTETVTEPNESQKLLTHPVRHVARQTIPQRNAIKVPMQPIDRLSGREDRKDKIRSRKEPTKKTRMKLLKLQPTT